METNSGNASLVNGVVPRKLMFNTHTMHTSTCPSHKDPV